MSGPEALLALVFSILALWGVLVLFVNEVERWRRSYAISDAIDRRVRFEARLAADVRRRAGEPPRGVAEDCGGACDQDEVPVRVGRR